MLLIAAREFAVVILACLLACLTSLLIGNANRNVAALFMAILIPIAFCLLRASFVKRTDPSISGFRHFGYQVCLGLAFILLLLFEMSFSMFFGADDIPPGVWAVVGGFAIGYVTFYCFAHQLGFNYGITCDDQSSVLEPRFADWPTNRDAGEPSDARETSAQSVLNSQSTPRSP